MRLIHTTTRKIEEYHGSDVPQYAILSHTWGRDEVSFADYHDPKYASRSWNTRYQLGWQKIDNACQQAIKQKFDHVWIDTCCIDKTSSAELSEAINSMAEWYRKAGVCLVYLQDVSQTDAEPVPDQFRKSRWFTRGWTLQELIFPKHVIFYDTDWESIGDKVNMKAEIMKITHIDSFVLTDAMYLSKVCVARRMSWAASRQSTRLEDRAYSLMGIFDVQMPLLYGEGDKAFQRLQEEILKKMPDPSILLWNPAVPAAMERIQSSMFRSILASSPEQFLCNRRVIAYDTAEHLEIEWTVAGLRILGPVIDDGDDLYIVLPCRYEDDYSGPIAIKLHGTLDPVLEGRPPSSRNDPLSVTREHNLGSENAADDFHRTVALGRVASAKYRTLILTTRHYAMSYTAAPYVAVRVMTSPQIDVEFVITFAEPQEDWSAQRKVMRSSVDWRPWTGQKDQHEILSHYIWRRKDGLGSLKLSVNSSVWTVGHVRGHGYIPGVSGFFKLAFDGDAETEISGSASRSNEWSTFVDPTHKPSHVLHIDQVCGGRDLALAAHSEHIMGDLVCTVEIAFRDEWEALPKGFASPEPRKCTRFVDIIV
jgi:hypothetical protein